MSESRRVFQLCPNGAPSMILSESAAALWYVAHVNNFETIVFLERFKDHYKITWSGRITKDGEDEPQIHTEVTRRKLVPMSEAIARCREMIGMMKRMYAAHAEWECIRGARSVEEFGNLIMSMPNCEAREATPEESAELVQELMRGAK